MHSRLRAVVVLANFVPEGFFDAPGCPLLFPSNDCHSPQDTWPPTATAAPRVRDVSPRMSGHVMFREGL